MSGELDKPSPEDDIAEIAKTIYYNKTAALRDLLQPLKDNLPTIKKDNIAVTSGDTLLLTCHDTIDSFIELRNTKTLNDLYSELEELMTVEIYPHSPFRQLYKDSVLPTLRELIEKGFNCTAYDKYTASPQNKEQTTTQKRLEELDQETREILDENKNLSREEAELIVREATAAYEYQIGEAQKAATPEQAHDILAHAKIRYDMHIEWFNDALQIIPPAASKKDIEKVKEKIREYHHIQGLIKDQVSWDNARFLAEAAIKAFEESKQINDAADLLDTAQTMRQALLSQTTSEEEAGEAGGSASTVSAPQTGSSNSDKQKAAETAIQNAEKLCILTKLDVASKDEEARWWKTAFWLTVGAGGALFFGASGFLSFFLGGNLPLWACILLAVASFVSNGITYAASGNDIIFRYKHNFLECMKFWKSGYIFGSDHEKRKVTRLKKLEYIFLTFCYALGITVILLFGFISFLDELAGRPLAGLFSLVFLPFSILMAGKFNIDAHCSDLYRRIGDLLSNPFKSWGAFFQTLCFFAAAYFSLAIGYSILTKFLGLFSISLLGISGLMLLGVFALITIPFLIEIVRNSGLDPNTKKWTVLGLFIAAIVIAAVLTPILGPIPWIVLACAFLAAPAASLVFKMMGNAILSMPANFGKMGTQIARAFGINLVIGVLVLALVLAPVLILIVGNALVYGYLCSEKADQVAPGVNGAVPLQAGATGFSALLGANGFASLLAKYLEKFNDFLEKSLPKYLTNAFWISLVKGKSTQHNPAQALGKGAPAAASSTATDVNFSSSISSPKMRAGNAPNPSPAPLIKIKNHIQKLCAPPPKASIVSLSS